MTYSMRAAIGYSGSNSLMPDACALIPRGYSIHDRYYRRTPETSRPTQPAVMDGRYAAMIGGGR